MKKFRLLVVLALIAIAIGACGKKASESAPPAAEKPIAKIETRMIKNWMIGLSARQPGLGAQRGVPLGEGKLGIRATPDAVSWFENADIDSNGTSEKVGFMWDANNKVMYAYTMDPVTLDDGSMADKGLIVAQFGDGNSLNRPLGSGFWAYATLRDTLGYRNEEGTLYGCRFNSAGEETECGPGTWSRLNNDFNIKTMVK